MEHKVSFNITNAIAANQFLWDLAYVVFYTGIGLLALYIRKTNNLTITETALAIVGLRKIKRNWVVNVLHTLGIIIPLLLMSYVIASYENT